MGFGNLIGGIVGVAKAFASGVASAKRKFTGEDILDEANERYLQLEKKVKKYKNEMEIFMKAKEIKINEELRKINLIRERLFREEFKDFIEIMSSFAGWEIEKKLIKEVADFNSLSVMNLREKKKLIFLDFEKHPIKGNLKAIFTLGFLTRKKAKQSLLNVKQEEERFEYEKKKSMAEKKRIEHLENSLKFISNTLEGYYQIYKKLLVEINYVLNFLENNYLLNNYLFFKDKLDIYFLPKEHVKVLMITEKMTRVLHSMSTKKYIDSSFEMIENDMKSFRESVEYVDKLKMVV